MFEMSLEDFDQPARVTMALAAYAATRQGCECVVASSCAYDDDRDRPHRSPALVRGLEALLAISY